MDREQIIDFREEVREELGEEESLLQSLQASMRSGIGHHIPVLVLLAISSLIIFFFERILIYWLLIGLLLFSYNFIIILIPTTTTRARPEEREALLKQNRDYKWLAIRLLLRKIRIGLEMGLTVFLGGMVPLTLSFSIIFGVGLVFTLYFSLLTNSINYSLGIIVGSQITLILLFYVMIITLEPQSQGITKFFRSLKWRMGDARSHGWITGTLIMMTVIGSVAVIGILFAGAFLLPGATLFSLFESLEMVMWIDIFFAIYMAIAQLVIMRHFQEELSLRMAIKMLRVRTERMRTEIIERLDSMIADTGLEEDSMSDRIRSVKKDYYSMVIYDIIRQDIYGRYPIYLVGPRLRYVLDEGVLDCLST